MEVERLRTEIIEISERHRALDDAACDRLAASMKEIGLLSPISIRVVDMMVIDGKEVEGVPVLVTGRHRLEAAKRLGWSHIDCIEVADDPIGAELWEIAENLHRLDLTKEQRNEHIRRYAELLDQRDRERIVLQDARQMEPQKRGRPVSTSTKIADETGLSYATVHRALNPQPVMIKAALEPESEHDATIREANAIVSAWNRARQEARDIAMDQMDGGPVFDRTRAAA